MGYYNYFTIPKNYDTLLKTGIKREKSDCDRDPKATGFSLLSIHLSEKVVWGMSFLKRHWLYAVSLVALLCVAIGAFLAWRANQPVESKTVYVMPEPNPNRAEILKRITQPPSHVYVPNASPDEATDAPVGETAGVPSDESSSQENDFEDEDLESMLAAIDEKTTEENGVFPPVPEGFPSHLTPVWLEPGYQKGDFPEHELMYRVLIKLWNQGTRGFIDAAWRGSDGKVYPIYPDVLYVEWAEYSGDSIDDDMPPVRYIASSLGSRAREFAPEDFVTRQWRNRYPNSTIIPYEEGGYDPYLFLDAND